MRVEDIDLTTCTVEQRSRAALVVLVKALWPTVTPPEAVTVAGWLRTGRWDLKL